VSPDDHDHVALKSGEIIEVSVNADEEWIAKTADGTIGSEPAHKSPM
jgi:hypothetical protein